MLRQARGLNQPRDDFFDGLRDYNYESVFDTFTPSLQVDVGSVDELKVAYVNAELSIKSWGTRGFYIKNGRGNVFGNFKHSDGTIGKYHLYLLMVNRK